MKSYVLLLLGASFTVDAQTQNSVPQAQMIRREMPPTPVRTGSEASASLKMIGGLPTIEVMVDGRGPFRMGIETGFPGYLVLSPDAVAKIGLTQDSEVTMGDPSGSGSQRIPIVKVENLTLAGVNWHGLQADVAPITSERLKGVDGFLGLEMFADLLMTVDYGAGQFALKVGKLQPGPGVVHVSRTEGGLLSIPVTIGDRTFPVDLDTGNTRHPLIMPQATIAALSTAGEPYAIGTARTISQQVTLSAQRLVAPVKAGNSLLDIHEVAFPSITDVGNLGSLGLTGKVLILDLKHELVNISPSKAGRG